MATIKRYAHKSLQSFLLKVAEHAAAGDFFDTSRWGRVEFGNRVFSAQPAIDMTSSKTFTYVPKFDCPETPTQLYKYPASQTLGDFIMDFQYAIKTGANPDIKTLVIGGRKLKPYVSINAIFKATTAKVSAVGVTQYSADGVTFTDTIPTGVLKVDTPVDFYIRTKPESVVAADDGTYDYQFKMVTAGAGGLSLVNDATEQNKAHITGKTPADQVGILFSVNTTVVDAYGTKKVGTALTQTWEAK
ncbi:head outer capsid protein [Yersinia phage vB_YenM_P778]